MTYEYKIIDLGGMNADDMNEYGAKGWKLVAISSSIMYFMREKEELEIESKLQPLNLDIHLDTKRGGYKTRAYECCKCDNKSSIELDDDGNITNPSGCCDCCEECDYKGEDEILFKEWEKMHSAKAKK